MPVEDFPNVITLEKQAGGRQIQVDTPDNAPAADPAEQGLTQNSAPPVAPKSTKPPAPPPTPAKPASTPVSAVAR